MLIQSLHVYQSQTEYIAHAPVAFSFSMRRNFFYSDQGPNSERLNLPVPTLTAQSQTVCQW